MPPGSQSPNRTRLRSMKGVFTGEQHLRFVDVVRVDLEQVLPVPRKKCSARTVRGPSILVFYGKNPLETASDGPPPASEMAAEEFGYERVDVGLNECGATPQVRPLVVAKLLAYSELAATAP